MKKILLLLFSLFILSCSSDDSSDPVIDSDVSTGDYFPLSNNNYWVYDVQGTMPSAVSDSIYISGDINFNGNTYKQFKMDEMPFGFLSSAINNNGVRKSGDRLLLSGSAMISFIQDFPMSIQLQDFTILNESAANGQVIGTTSGTVPYPYGDYTFNFNYTLTSTSMGDIATYTAPNGEVYTNVKAVKTTLGLTVNTIIDAGVTTFPVNIMQPQDVVVSTRYFAEGVGIVHSNTDIHYELENFAQFGITLPLPQTMTAEQDEILVNYQAE
jgi:hypothetical protein